MTRIAVLLLALLLCIRPALAADPTPIGVWELGGDKLELFEVAPSFCMGGSQLARYTLRPPSGATIPGCWIVEKDRVRLEFADGDAFTMPVRVITWAPGKSPAAM